MNGQDTRSVKPGETESRALPMPVDRPFFMLIRRIFFQSDTIAIAVIHV